jgi:RNA polymerase sigma-70 factor (ECF subfamily)
MKFAERCTEESASDRDQREPRCLHSGHGHSESAEGLVIKRRRVLDQLYRTHRGRLVRFFRRRGHKGDVSEDLIHDVFVRLSGLPDELLIERPGAMAYRLAKFVSVEVYRKSARQRQAGFECDSEGGDFDSVDSAPTPEQMTVYRETVSAIYRLASALPKRCGEVVILHRIHGWSPSEIAAKKGVSVKTVECHVTLGRKRFDAPARYAAQLALAS